LLCHNYAQQLALVRLPAHDVPAGFQIGFGGERQLALRVPRLVAPNAMALDDRHDIRGEIRASRRRKREKGEQG
jgi:hypothetical protein